MGKLLETNADERAGFSMEAFKAPLRQSTRAGWSYVWAKRGPLRGKACEGPSDRGHIMLTPLSPFVRLISRSPQNFGEPQVNALASSVYT